MLRSEIVSPHPGCGDAGRRIEYHKIKRNMPSWPVICVLNVHPGILHPLQIQII